MIEQQLRARGITDNRVLAAFEKVNRKDFVMPGEKSRSYEDCPLPISNKQTISQPYIVAYMSQELRIDARHRVLEVGTGSGYQAAILSELASEVYTVERIKPLHTRAVKNLAETGHENVHVFHSDGFKGIPEEAPFDRIMLTAAPDKVPKPLLQQLSPEGGLLVGPTGAYSQTLYRIRRNADRFIEETLCLVRFVPMLKGTQ